MKKYIIPILDVLLAIYLVFAVVSFNNPSEEYPVCTQVSIDVADQSSFGFLNKKEIVSILKKHGLYPVGKPMASVNPDVIENVLKKSPFIKTAECSKSKDGKVFVTITQRTPILRIKNSFLKDFYIDENGGVMPNTTYTSDLIIATGRIDKNYAEKYLCVLANIINASEMWSNEIEQINITDDHGVELIPRVGDHIIFLGYLPESKSPETRKKEITEFVNKQFDRLVLFYKYGLSQTGWNRYERIDLQYPNQIICKKKGAEMARLAAEAAAASEADRKMREELNPANRMAGTTEVHSATTPEVKKPEAPKKTTTKTKAETKKQETKKQETKKQETKKQETKKQETKKKDVKKPETKKTEKSNNKKK